MHTKNIYRLNEVQKFPGMVSSQKVALSMYPMGQTLKNDFPEIQNFTHIRWMNKFQIAEGEKRMYLPQVLSVDTSFLNIFDFPLVKGNRQTALLKPNSVVLTESTALKFFGNTDPMGKTLTHYDQDTTSFTVTGVVKDAPSNSQLQFDAISSFIHIQNPG
jgi:putative ABC transport system permease protein